ncbi:MAG: hypothetical protein RH862_06240 [Leptospiraceae bacterium]
MIPTGDDEKRIPLEDIDVSDLGLVEPLRSDLFLGSLKVTEVEDVLKNLGLFREIENRGYTDWKLLVETGSLQDNRIHIYSRDTDLFFLRLKIGMYPVAGPAPLRLISVDWFLTQNLNYSGDKLFPGQNYPGLGSGVLFVFKDLIREFVERSHASGIITVPEYFHDAALFTRFMECKFVSPEKAADFKNLSFAGKLRRTSHAIHSGRVREKKTGAIYRWRHGEMVSFKSEHLNRTLFDRQYWKLYKKHLDPNKYEILE